MNLLDKICVASRISLTYIKSLFIKFLKTIGLFSKVLCLLPQIICFLNWIAEFNIVKKSIKKKWINIIKTENSAKSTVNIKRNKIIWKNNFIETSYLSNKMLYNSQLLNKIEFSLCLLPQIICFLISVNVTGDFV
jgi:hypothetical protein